jgi:superfamily II DNA or RNA helicase
MPEGLPQPTVRTVSENCRTLAHYMILLYDFIIVDEFHHTAASTYQKLLDLTAAPEYILDYFGDRIASSWM